MPEPISDATVIDVSGLVVGRAASLIAQRLLAGEAIVVVHAEKSVITGSRRTVLEHYRAARARGSKRTGPHFPRYPDRIFRRTVRGMLPHLKTRGKIAYARLAVHIGVPAEYAGKTAETLATAKARPSVRPPMTLEAITRLLGAHAGRPRRSPSRPASESRRSLGRRSARAWGSCGTTTARSSSSSRSSSDRRSRSPS